ncbi:MAG: 30S ribosomal protein S12 methylthiotransferase RimO [Chloroherpetonaceae bacterium]|nr:30S ribosomal protein S12 methylthiotransferase RimO [Chloroherpetonaceae bacterium]
MKTKLPKLHVLTLGCSKNVVDSEMLLAQARANQFLLTDDPRKADVLVINTCGFIEEAKQESIDHILDGVELRKKGRLKKLLVMGCLSERYHKELAAEIPEVDRYFGVLDFEGKVLSQILEEMGGHLKNELLGERWLSTPQHFAYLKISEGCDHPCSFCAIPLMRGKHRSKPMEVLLAEATALRQRGVKELILIAQDLTYYGLDLYGKRKLDELLRRLSDIGFEWIRLLYAYPAKFPKEILPVIRERENLCKYLDIPIQHINDEVLRSMRRGITKRKLIELLSEIRTEVPNIRLRTTFIFGYPIETEEIFQEALDFIEEAKFDRLGCFAYSHEENTAAFALQDAVPPNEKLRRVETAMTLQAEISAAKNQQLIGTRLRVLIDRIEKGVAVGRTEFDAPEVDNEVIITSAQDGFLPAKLAVGEFYEVEITEAEAFDIFGTITKKL